ncbi:PREDICTED: uncharacterized protein LOC109325021 [Lupinus angustifolius]|uniref:uncharacterized protein LOC109325020 n=1 Tax=Lupinus angustifolius TaxID=3871 RepID=UPI00092F9FDC|nr:PREDICTED: uncharacterized protein LOC109325020 [Lupinus angustifolius]XP_019412713.1 PREDICTED: uncharacterized protein LOC109325021 [Lupinus angustifolius]
MDNDKSRRKNSISGDSFSFPSTPNQDSEFEFGSLTPDSPSSDPCRTSPADKLFFNGRLQPHSFPVIFHRPIGPAIATSHTSSISSKDSLVSSRSNSTNSSRSSARTSSSDNSERRLFHNKVSVSLTSSYSKGSYTVNRSVALGHNKQYRCSRRWQYITPVPALNRDASKRRSGDMKQRKKEEGKKRRKKKKVSRVGLRFVRRILRWFVITCRECHAMEPSKVKNQKIRMQKNVNM